MFHTIKILACIVVMVLFQHHAFSQANCGTAAPFCANQGAVTFPASTNTSAQAGPDYGCLFSQPNPSWYYFQVSASGIINIDIAGTGGGDVDFICWGPFTSPTASCGNLTSTNDVDCSFSSSPTETCTIPAAVSGQYYMLLLTNYSGQSQNISFTQSSGSGSTNCGLLNSSVNSQSICPGKSATITATSSFTNPTYLWSNGATTPSIVVSPTASSVFSVTISGLDATGTPTNISNTSTVTIYTVPTISLTTNNNICPNSTINLTASPGFTSYAWFGPPNYNQTTTTGLANITNATLAMSGTYSVIGTTVKGCTNTAIGSVSIVPTATIAINSASTICEGGSVNLTANATNASSYSWQGPSGYNSALQNPVINPVLLNQAGIYTVVASFTQGVVTCTNNATTNLVIVPSAPAVLAPIPNVCNNGIINLIAPNGGTTYNWTGPNSFNSALQNPIINNASIVEAGVYTVVIATNGCINTGTLDVSVYGVLSFSVLPTNASICANKTTTFTSKAIGGSGIYAYNWFPINGLQNPNNPTTQATGTTTTTYTLVVTDAQCAVTTPIASTVLLTVNPTPVISFSTSNARGCEPFCTDLNSSSIPASVNCDWKFNNSLTNNSCNTASFCFANHGSYNAQVTVTDVNGCVDSLTQTAFIIVDPKPIADFDWTEPNPNIITNDVKFFDKSTIGAPMMAWSWNFGDSHSPIANDTSSLKNPTHIYDYVGTYLTSLNVTNSFGCKDTVKKIVTIEDDFAMYIPNAFSPGVADGKNDVFKVAGSGFMVETFEMYIFDRWGALVYKTSDVFKGWDGTIKGREAKQDVYVYKIKVKDYKNRAKEFVGHLTIL